MSYGQPSDPQGPQQQGPYPHQQMPGPYPHQQQPGYYGSPSGAPAPEPRKGALPAVGSLILGVLACVVPLLPTYTAVLVSLEMVRPLLWFPFAIPGFVLGIIGLRGRRSGQLLAVFGAMFSVLALIGGLIMVVNWYILG